MYWVCKFKLQSYRNKGSLFTLEDTKVASSNHARDVERNFVVSLTKVFERDLPNLDEAVVKGLPLRSVDDGVVGAEDVVEPVEGVDEVLDR